MKTAAVAATFAALLLCSCSLKSNGPSYQIRIPLPGAKYSFLNWLDNLAYAGGTTTPYNLNDDPSSLNDFDCFAVNVSGPGILPHPNISCADPSNSPGIVGGFVPATDGAIDLEVPAGPARHIQLFGVRSTLTGCPAFKDLFAPGNSSLLNDIGHLYDLGGTYKDITGDDTVVIHVNYDSTQPKRIFSSCNVNGSKPRPPGVWNVYQNSSPGVDAPGTVNASIALNGQVYLGGLFDYVGPSTGEAGILSQLTGALISNQAHAHIDSSGGVSCIAPDGNGGYYAGGSFTQINGTSVGHLAHILADGSLDPNFTASANAAVSQCVFDGTYLFVAGTFSNITGDASLSASTIPLLAAIDINSKAALPLGSISADQIQSGTINALALSPSKELLYVGGSFSAPGSEMVAYNTSDLALDTSWTPSISGGTYGVKAITTSGTHVYVGGDFTSPQSFIADFDSSSASFNNSWNPSLTGVAVNALASDGTYVYAAFDDGSFNYVYGIDSSGTYPFPVSFTLNSGQILSLAYSQLQNRLYVGGQFPPDPSGTFTSQNLVSLDPSNHLGPDSGFNGSASNPVQALATDSNGRLFVGGSFQSVGGFARTNLAAIDLSTGAATKWAPQTDSTGQVDALATDGSRIFIGGSFTTISNPINSQNIQSIAAVDATNGGIDSGWSTSAGTNSGKTVYALAYHAGVLYAGGDFTTINTTGPSFAAALNPTTGVPIATWTPSITGTAIKAVLPTDTSVYLGGSFSTVNGSSHYNLAQVDLSGAPTSFTADAGISAADMVNTLVLDHGRLFVGGTFSTLAGDTHTNLGAVNASDGSDLINVDWGASSLYPVNTLAARNGTLYVGGTSSTGSEAIAFDITQEGYPASSWTPNVSNASSYDSVFTILPTAYGIFMGGNFQQVNGLSPGSSRYSPAIGLFDPSTGSVY